MCILYTFIAQKIIFSNFFSIFVCEFYLPFKTKKMKQIFTLIALFCVAALSAQPLRTVTFTGNVATDFKSVERTQGSGTSYAICWNAAYLYIGVTGGGSYIKNEPTIVYIDTLGTGGKDTGFNYDNRRPILPFTANCVVYFKSSYAEIRRDSAFGFDGWSTQKNISDSVFTGANDIEIRIPWKSITGKGIPKNFAALFFKTNGFGGGADPNAYDVKPGVGDKNTNFSANVNATASSIQLFYRFRTETKFYTNINVFSWIDNKLGNLCAAPATSSESLITKNSVKFSWAAVAGVKQYQVRRKVAGSSTWTTSLIPGTRTYQSVSSLSPSTTYNWLVRALCDTTGTVDIASGFTAQRTFTTLAMRDIAISEQEGINELSIYPIPARRGSRINVSSQEYKNNAGFSIYNIAGKQVQQGTINGGAVNLNANINGGTYILELRSNNSVIRKKIVVMD